MPGKKRNSKYTMGRRNEGGLVDLTLPSGDTCQAKRVGPAEMIRIGILDSFDELTALVQEEHIAPKTTAGQIAAAKRVEPAEAQAAVQALIRDKDKLAASFHLVDRMVVGVVAQPPVWIDYQTKDETEAEFADRAAKAEADEAVAVRDIDLEDKMFIVNWAMGGSRDLKSFREGREQLMGDLETSAAVQLPTE